MSKKIKFIFFDFDGTISDARRLTYDTMIDVLDRMDFKFSRSKLKKLMGIKMQKILYGLGIDEKFVNKIRKIFYKNLIKNVIAANADASTVLALDVMTSPVITAPQTMTIIQAMQLMSKQGIRHLIILKKGKVAGMCSDTDIFKVVPQLIMLEQEYLNVLGESQVTEELPDLAGYCDDCKEFREILIFHQGLYICHNCAPVGLLESNE